MIESLNHVTAEMLAEVRRLSETGSRLDVERYLAHNVARAASRGWVADFVRDVVFGGADPAGWGFQDLLVIAPASEPLAATASSLVEVLGPLEGERWWCVGVDDVVAVRRRAGEPHWGAPGVLQRRAPYWWRAPSSLMTIVVGDARLGSPSGPLAPVSDPVIGLRRWIARNAARALADTGADLATLSPEAAVERLKVDASDDGRIALAALLREARLPFDYRRQVPGFVGPDGWYA